MSDTDRLAAIRARLEAWQQGLIGVDGTFFDTGHGELEEALFKIAQADIAWLLDDRERLVAVVTRAVQQLGEALLYDGGQPEHEVAEREALGSLMTLLEAE